MADIAWINPSIHATAADWATRVVNNGGAAVSDRTLYAVSNFCGALDAAAISSLMISVNVFAPDNLTAAITPLYKVYGNDPWTNTAFVVGDLSVQGLKGNGSTKFLDTGVLANTAFPSANEGGLTVYNSYPEIRSSHELSCNNTIGANWFGLVVCEASSNSQFFTWSNGTQISVASLKYGLGFLSGSRESATNAFLYAANSINPFSAIGTWAVNTLGSAPTFNLFAFARSNAGVAASFSSKRLSFAAAHRGLTSTQTQSLFNAVQALRTALGGGYL